MVCAFFVHEAAARPVSVFISIEESFDKAIRESNSADDWKETDNWEDAVAARNARLR